MMKSDVLREEMARARNVIATCWSNYNQAESELGSIGWGNAQQRHVINRLENTSRGAYLSYQAAHGLLNGLTTEYFNTVIAEKRAETGALCARPGHFFVLDQDATARYNSRYNPKSRVRVECCAVCTLQRKQVYSETLKMWTPYIEPAAAVPEVGTPVI